MSMIATKILAGILLIQSVVWGEMIPSDALERLQEGNLRYIEGTLIHPDRSAERRIETASQQTPFAAIVGCADSRVSPEIIFDQGIGDLFVVRVAGNVIGPIEMDSVEYAVEYLGASLVLTMGHSNCGAVKAVLDDTTEDIEAVAEKIQPAIRKLSKKGPYALENAIKANAQYVAKELEKSLVLKKYIDQNTLKILPAYYNFDNGKVEILSK